MPSIRAAAAPAALVLVLGLLALGAVFAPEIRAAISTWNSSTAYGHCYLILPMAAYLAWDRRESLAGLRPWPEPSAALLALPVGALWLLAERLGIMEGRQLMAMAAVQVLILAVMGRHVVWALLGPLLFLFFLVPFGAFLTPGLQQFTARFTVAGLNLLRIPNVSDELTIEIPAGTFYVAEACAGLRFLIAAVAFGVFYALLNYRSPGRRVAFIAASIVIPIVANGFRALGIVVLGHVLGSAQAAAADHVVYGWVFFSLVLMALVLAGLPLREPPLPRVAPTPANVPSSGASLLWAAIGACLLAATGPAVAGLLDRQVRPAPFAALPPLVLPQACRQTGPAPSLPATRATLAWECGVTAVDVTIETFPARATAASLLVQRRQATGELVAEEVDTESLHVTASTNAGAWTVVITTRPYRQTAFAAWVDGAPAQGGLAGRWRQARASVMGDALPAVLMTLSVRQDSRPGPEQQRMVLDLLRLIVSAQPALSDGMAALARSAGG